MAGPICNWTNLLTHCDPQNKSGCMQRVPHVYLLLYFGPSGASTKSRTLPPSRPRSPPSCFGPSPEFQKSMSLGPLKLGHLQRSNGSNNLWRRLHCTKDLKWCASHSREVVFRRGLFGVAYRPARVSPRKFWWSSCVSADIVCDKASPVSSRQARIMYRYLLISTPVDQCWLWSLIHTHHPNTFLVLWCTTTIVFLLNL